MQGGSSTIHENKDFIALAALKALDGVKASTHLLYIRLSHIEPERRKAVLPERSRCRHVLRRRTRVRLSLSLCLFPSVSPCPFPSGASVTACVSSAVD